VTQGLETEHLRNFVNGEYADTAQGRRSELIDPATGQVFATAPVSDAQDVDAAFRTARRAFEDGWRDWTPAERQIALNRFADGVEVEPLAALGAEGEAEPVGPVDEVLVLDDASGDFGFEAVVSAGEIGAGIVRSAGVGFLGGAAGGEVAVAERAEGLARRLVLGAPVDPGEGPVGGVARGHF
jgi:hypothetical protein